MMGGIDKPHARTALAALLLSAAAILAISSLADHAGAMVPQGRIFCFAEERWQRWGPYGEVEENAGTLAHLHGELTPVNWGIWNFRIESARDGEEFRVQAREIPSLAGRVAFGVGDLELPPADCAEAILRELQPSTWHRGASAQVSRGPTTVELMGGRLTHRIGRLHPTRSATGTAIGGLRLRRDIGNHSHWQLDWHRQEAAPGDSAGRQVLSGTFLRATSPRGIQWLGQVRLARDDGDRSYRTSMLTGLRWTATRFATGLSIRRIATGFHGLGLHIASRSNEWGARAEVFVRPAPGARVSGSADWAEDIEKRSSVYPKERRFQGRIGLQIPISPAIYARSDASYRNRSGEDRDSLLVDQGVWNGSGEIGWHNDRSLASYRFSRGMRRDPSARNDEWHRTGHSARISHRFHRNWRARLDLLSETRRDPDGTWLSREERIGCHLGFEPLPASQAWLGLARDAQEANQEAFKRNQWEIVGGLDQDLPHDLTLQFEGSLFVSASGGRAESGRWSLRLSRSFSVGTRRNILGGKPLEFGSVRGCIFDDLNGNGRQDDGEPGIPDQTLRLGSGAQVTTGRQGTYEFRGAAVGCDWIVFDPHHLPPCYLAPQESRIQLTLQPGEEAAIDFPITRASAICGRVLGVRPDGSLRPLPDILVRITGSPKDVFTDQAGRFRFHDLEEGVVDVEFVAWSVPDGWVGIGVPAHRIALEAGNTSMCDDFVLRRSDPPVIQRFRQRPD
jgi:hypothetical protein